jgi:glutathione S-transferase
MKLFYSASSPFARKVRVVAREKGMAGGLTEIECNPFADPGELREHNKLGKVPTLVAGDLVLYDSPVICEYLDARKDGHRLIPMSGSERWRVLRAQALADGLMEVAVNLTLERRRPQNEQSPGTQQRWRAQIAGALDTMEEQLPDLSPAILNLGHIAFGVALGYLDFRYADMRWRDTHPALCTWFEAFAMRPSMQQTAPSDSSYQLAKA